MANTCFAGIPASTGAGTDLRRQKSRRTFYMNPIREKQMPEYLIDMRTMTTFWVTAPSEKKALEALMEATYDLELRLEIGEETPISWSTLPAATKTLKLSTHMTMMRMRARTTTGFPNNLV
ncbi:hypothetical protein AJ87_14010 [Rhizobium yanglingense]|nr:hypothetical protein AJ87_14010 [Rhizobium yanglingense]